MLLVSIVAVTLGIYGVIAFLKKDAARLEGYEDAAKVVGMARAKQECFKEGLRVEICSTLTGDISTSECHGMTCWVVYARSTNQEDYWASVTINKQGEEYKVINYGRNSYGRQ